MRNEQMSSEQLAVSSGRKTVSRVKKCSVSLLLIAHYSLLTVLSCNNPFESPKQSAPVEAGYGRVSINFVGGEERTVFPAKIFDNYVYTFSKDGESSVLSPDDNGLFTLEVGEWRVDVTAYVDEINPANRAAAGTGNFTVNSDITIEVTVILDAVVTTGYGTFIYTIQYPAIANAEVTLQKLPGLTDGVELTPDSTETSDNITTVTKTAENVPAGFYLLTVQIRNGGWHTGISEAVHIYPLLTTEYTAEFDEADLLPTVIDIANIRGITPVIGQAPPTEITETEQYTGTVTWNPNPATFVANTTYTASITLAAKEGNTLQDIPENFFTVSGATSVTNAAGSGAITAVFTTPHSYLIVTNTTEWNSALSTIRGGGNNRRYIIDVRGNVGVGGIASSSSTIGLGTVTGITVTLMGNGKLYLTGQGRIIMVGDNQTLVIDSEELILEGLKNGQNGAVQDNYTSSVYVDGINAKLELKNGTISGNTGSYDGGGVNVSSGSFTMTGGTISGNTGSLGGGGVYVSGGSFTMTGGTISGSGGPGVRVVLSGSFTMTGGTISGNGGGVSVGDNGGSFIMTGGTISGNGGGVYCGNYGNFTMTGGTISGNTSSGNGGGVYCGDFNSNFTMTGGTISGNNTSSGYGGGVYFGGSSNVNINGHCNFTFGGTAQVYGNTRAGTLDNVYLQYSRTDQYITLGIGANAPAYGMNVYVHHQYAQYQRERNIVQSDATVEAASYFHVDNDDRVVILSGTQLVIVDRLGRITSPLWYDGCPVSLVAPMVSPPAGQTAQGWQISGNGSDGWSNFTPPPIVDMSWHGKYLRYYATNSDGETYYSNTVIIRVATRGVTIDMYDSGGNGWNGELIINVNGLYLATDVDVKVQNNDPQNTPNGQSSFNTYAFSVEAGDVVQLYWTRGAAGQSEISFIAYYTDMPPNPAFTPNNNWSGANALVYRLRGTMYGVRDGTLLGSFTVP